MPVLSSVFSFIFFPSLTAVCAAKRPRSVSAQTRSIIFIRRTDNNGCQEDVGLCLRVAEVVLLSDFAASWLRSVVTGGEKRGRGGGEESIVSLSWHRLQNNWTAYQVSPQSFNCMFQAWLVGILFIFYKRRPVHSLDIINNPPAWLCSCSSIDLKFGSRFWLFLLWNQFVCVDASVCADLLIFGDWL